jgi:uncharacterized membrane protein YgcG
MRAFQALALPMHAMNAPHVHCNCPPDPPPKTSSYTYTAHVHRCSTMRIHLLCLYSSLYMLLVLVVPATGRCYAHNAHVYVHTCYYWLLLCALQDEMSNEEVLLLQQAIENSRVHQFNTDVVGSSMPEAPSFHPTLEEFRDPLAYIKSLQAHGERVGIIKIVPPKGWAPPPPPHLLQSTTATATVSNGSSSSSASGSASSGSGGGSSSAVSSSDGSSSNGAAAGAATGSDAPPAVPPAALRFNTKLQQIHELQQGSDYGEGRMYTAAGTTDQHNFAFVVCMAMLCSNLSC